MSNAFKRLGLYRAHIQLTEEDVVAMLPEVVYDKDKCEVIAYSSGNDLKIDRFRSEYIVSSIKKEIVDIRDLALQLKDAVDLYEKQLTKISHDGYEELPIHCIFVNDVRPKRRKNNQVQRIVKRPAGVERERRSEAEE